MDQVYAPWRIDWVERADRNADVDGCVFCALPDQVSDRENNLVARGVDAYVLLNNYPYNPGHSMIIPHTHTGDYRELDDETLVSLSRLTQRTLDAIDTAMDPDGFNVGYNLGGAAAGGSIDDHLHAHVVPRWSGDTNFMPVVSETKVIVEAVTETYDRLHDAFADQEGGEADAGDRAVELDV